MDTTGYLPLAAASGLQRALDVTANNLANANTAGFRGQQLVFEELLAPRDQADPAAFAATRLSFTDTRAGTLSSTGNPLDMAIQGPGWFGYELADGQIGYGRDGRFVVTAEGVLTTTTGRPVLDAGGAPVVLPPDSGVPQLGRDGTLSDGNGEMIGAIGVFSAPDLATWTRSGEGYFLPRQGAAPLEPQEGAVLVQGATEASNINPVREMVRLIEVQRAFDLNLQVTGNHDELRRNALSRLGQRA